MLVCPAASLHRSDGLLRYRNFNLFSIAYASLPRLRSRLTLRRRSLLRNPRAFGGLDSHQPFRYSYQHSHFLPLHGSLRYRFSVIRTLPYPDCKQSAIASVPCLSPGHLRRSVSRPVSYYALFECMAASEPTSWLFMKRHILRHLARHLGP